MSRDYTACREKVHNRGRAPVEFLDALVDWALQAPDEIFVANDRRDIYSVVSSRLGPWRDLRHRKAAMLEVLRVLGGFESSWGWNEGVDVTNPSSNTPCTEEAGIFQCSGNSMSLDPSLRDLLQRTAGATDCDTFRQTTKTDRTFAIEYCARLLRFTVRHHGPVRDGHIQPWLLPEAVAEFERLLG